jgi:hypothetical protein
MVVTSFSRDRPATCSHHQVRKLIARYLRLDSFVDHR